MLFSDPKSAAVSGVQFLTFTQREWDTLGIPYNIELVENKYVASRSLNDEQKLFYLFTNEENDVCRGISKFTFEGLKQR